MNEELTLADRYEITGEGLRAVNSLTGEVLKLAKAEEMATARAKEMVAALTAARGPGGSVSPSPAASGSPPPASAIPADLDAGLSERLARAVESLAAEMRQLPEQIRLGVREGLANPAVAGTGGVADGFGPDGSLRRLQPVSDKPDSEGIRPRVSEDTKEKRERPWWSSGRAAAVAGAASLVDIGARAAQSAAEPFVDPLDRQWKFARQFNIPGTNIGVGGIRDIIQGIQRDKAGVNVDEARRRVLESFHESDILTGPYESFKVEWDQRVRMLNRQAELAYGLVPNVGAVGGPTEPPKHPGPAPGTRENPITARTNEGEYRARLLLYEQQKAEYDKAQARRRELAESQRFAPQMPLADLPGLARETAGDQRRYDEAMARLPGQDRQVEARRTRETAQTLLKGVEEDYIRTAKRIAEASATYARLNQRIETGDYAADGGIERAQLQADRAKAAKTMRQGEQLLRDLDDRKLGLSEEFARSKAGVREADTQMKRIELTQAQQREATARSQAERLTELGPAGRAQALAVAEIEREAGYENLPAELRAMYQSAFPETARKKAEAAGQQFVGEFRGYAPDEYRDTVGASRDAVNQLLQEIRKSEQESPGLLFKDILEATRLTYDRWKRLSEDLKVFIKQYEAESRVKNSEGGG